MFLHRNSFSLFVILTILLTTLTQSGESYGALLNQEILHSNSIAWSKDGLYVAIGAKTKVEILDSEFNVLKELNGHTTDVASVVFSPDGKYLASGDDSGVICFWSIDNWNNTKTLYSGMVPTIIFSADGKLFASGDWDGKIIIWDTNTWREIRKLKHADESSNALSMESFLNSQIRSIAFSPDGKYLVSGGNDGIVCIWSTDTWNKVNALKGHEHWISCVTFSPDGKYIVSGSHDGVICIWDTKTGENIQSYSGHDLRTISISFSPDGKFLASGGDGRDDRTGGYVGELFIWRTDTWNKVDTEGKLKRHFGSVISVAYSPDGKYLASKDPINVNIWLTDTWTLKNRISLQAR
jgi:WD40 repeat protein